MNLYQDRRTFLKSTAAMAALGLFPWAGWSKTPLPLVQRAKKPAVIRGAFFYPPAADVLAGKAEDSWSKHEWFTWPGNQFKPEEQQVKFISKVKEISAGLDLEIALEPNPLHTNAGIEAFLNSVAQTKPEALLLFNFWNSFSAKLVPILKTFSGPIILYHPVGANHQLPPEIFRTAPRVQYIHSIENWAALERGLRSVHTMNRMKQSRVLRVSGQATKITRATEPFFGTEIVSIPAGEFNDLFDATAITPELERIARQVRRQARKVSDLADVAFKDAVRSHATVLKIMDRHEADAITIECLFLKHRKPCLSFALNNGNLVPCGCENHLDATLSLMLGSACFGRGGFQHNPEYDTEQNLYFASHCTCTTRLHGPQAKPATYDLRPFFHQMPKSLALDVQWPVGDPVTLFKYHGGKNQAEAWRGKVIGSPTSPPTGGCATRTLVQLENVPDVCTVYPGPHPILYCGDFARHAQTFGKLYALEVKGNA